MDTIEPYRRELFLQALHTFRPDGSPLYNFVLSGRGKKNSKSSDLVLAGLFKLLIPESPQGNDGFLIAMGRPPLEREEDDDIPRAGRPRDPEPFGPPKPERHQGNGEVVCRAYSTRL